MKLKEKKEWIKKLKPFWEARKILHDEFRKKEMILEDKMKRELKEDLEFFYSDGEAVGIGHIDFNRRKEGKDYFPLFQAEDLGGY